MAIGDSLTALLSSVGIDQLAKDMFPQRLQLVV